MVSGLGASVAFGQDTKSLREAEEIVQARLKDQCATLESTIAELKGEKSFALATYEGQYLIQCKCLPEELTHAVDAQPTDTRITEEALVAMLRPLTEKCVARGMRQMLARGCDSPDNDDVSQADRARYCDCLNKGVAALSDEQLFESSQAASRDFEAAAKAKEDGTPPPAEEPSATKALEASCKKR
jgi:hypothetical protein